MIDHTLLTPEATFADVENFIDEGVDLGVFSVCINPTMLNVDTRGLVLVTVCGFPSGAHESSIKADEASQAVDDGAIEIDMVMNLGLAKAGDWLGVRHDIEAVRKAISEWTVLKVIIESAVLTDHEIVQACRAAHDAGADFVKTSTGLHPAGGATTHAVSLMKETVGDALHVKASGGIRTLDEALAMIEAGASRLGLSRSASILAQLD